MELATTDASLNLIVEDVMKIPNYREKALKHLCQALRLYLYSAYLEEEDPNSQKHDSDKKAQISLELISKELQEYSPSSEEL